MVTKQYTSIDELKNLPEEVIRMTLSEDPNFKKLLDEFDGKFSCYYVINGCGIFLLNEIGGSINVFGDLLRISNNIDDIYIAQLFAQRILKLKLQKD